MSFNLGSLKYQIGLDDSELEKGLRSSERRLKAFSDRATKVGKNLSLKLTLPLTLLGGAAIKTAADFEVYERKLLTATDGSDQLGAAIQNLTENFGFSSVQATRLTANTADLLRGFGATGDEALDLSTQLQEMSAALAAYSGIDITQVSEKFNAAITGQTMSLRQLGIVIRQSDIDAELLARGFDNLEGEARQLAAAQVVLDLATRQSQDAIGSFADNQDTLAFRAGQLRGQLQDLAQSFGEVLLPAATRITTVLGDVINYLSDLDDKTKIFIVTMGALAAAAGPAALAIGKISAAMAFLAANPLVLAAAGVAALTTGIVLLVDAGNKWVRTQEEIARAGREAWRENRLQVLETATSYEEASGQIRGLSRAMFEAAQETGNFELALREAERADSLNKRIQMLESDLEKMGNTTVAARRAIDVLGRAIDPHSEGRWWDSARTEAERFNRVLEILIDRNGNLETSIANAATAEQRRAIWNAISARDSEALTEALQAVGQETDEIIELQKELNAIRSGEAIREYVDETERAAQIEAERVRAAQEAERLAEENRQRYLVAREEVLDILRSEKSEYDQIQERIDRLQRTPWASGQLETDRLKAIETLRQRQQEILDEEEKRIDEINDRYIERLRDREREDIERMEARRDAELKNEDLTQEGRAAIIAFWDAEIAAYRETQDAERIKQEEDKLRDLEELREYWANRRAEQEASTIERLERRRDEAISKAMEDEKAIADIKLFYAREIEEEQKRIDREKEERDRRQQEQEEREAAAAIARRNRVEEDSKIALARILDDRLFILDTMYQREIAAAEEAGANTTAIQVRYKIEREKLLEELAKKSEEIEEEIAENTINYTQLALNFLKDVSRQILDIFTGLRDNRIALIDEQLDHELAALEEWRDAQLEAAGIVAETRIEELQRQLEAAIEAEDEETAKKLEEEIKRAEIDEEFDEKRRELEKQAALEKYEIELELFKANRLAALANIAISTAESIMKAFAMLGPAAAALVPVYVALGAAQAGVVISQPPPPRPQLAAGGLIERRPGGLDVTVGEGSDDELVLPLNDDVFQRFANGLLDAIADTRPGRESVATGQDLTIIIEGLGQVQLDLTQRAIQDRKIRIPASSITRR